MAITLKKPLCRHIPLVLRQNRTPQDIIVTLYPEGLIGFRHKRQRKDQEFLLDLQSAYLLAAQKTAQRLIIERSSKKRQLLCRR